MERYGDEEQRRSVGRPAAIEGVAAAWHSVRSSKAGLSKVHVILRKWCAQKVLFEASLSS